MGLKKGGRKKYKLQAARRKNFIDDLEYISFVVFERNFVGIELQLEN